MCGRFVSTSTPDRLADYFDATPTVAESLRPSFNVAPTTTIYIVRDPDGGRVVDTARWGLVPPWAKSPADRPAPINARSETVAEKRSFKAGFEKRRAIVPADGFYEWQKQPSGPKRPFYIHLGSGEPMALAAIWGEWRDPADEEAPPVNSCAILTTTPNDVMAPVHDRMPVVLSPDDFDEWLDPANHDVAELQDLLRPCDPGRLVLDEVGRRVNSVRENDSGLIEPVA